MKNKFCIVLLLMAVTFYGCTKNDPEKEVATAVSQFTATLIHPEKQSLDKLISDDVSYGHSIGLVQDKAGIIDGLLHGPFHFITINTTGQTIKIVNDIAIVRQTLSGDDVDGGVPAKFKFGILLVWHQEGGQWKLLARQAIKL